VSATYSTRACSGILNSSGWNRNTSSRRPSSSLTWATNLARVRSCLADLALLLEEPRHPLGDGARHEAAASKDVFDLLQDQVLPDAVRLEHRGRHALRPAATARRAASKTGHRSGTWAARRSPSAARLVAHRHAAAARGVQQHVPADERLEHRCGAAPGCRAAPGRRARPSSRCSASCRSRSARLELRPAKSRSRRLAPRTCPRPPRGSRWSMPNRANGGMISTNKSSGSHFLSIRLYMSSKA
jgi:hypothetical protein